MARSEHDLIPSSSGEEPSEGSESESESEPDNASTPPLFSKKVQPVAVTSSHESESEPDSDSDSGEDPTPANVKPLASKPTHGDSPKKPRSKNPTSRYSPPPLKSATGKRPSAAAEEKTEGRESKRAKKKVVIAVEAPAAGEKKQLFQRLWSEENEIELIQGMISYSEKNGKDPIADLNDFHEFVKKSLKIDVNGRQMSTKVKRLKKKFENNAGKVEKKGKVRSFSKPHEKKMYELSKKLWGNNNGAKIAPKKTPKNKTKSNVIGGVEASAIEVENVQSGGAGAGGRSSVSGQLCGLKFPITDEEIMSKGLGLLEGSKKVEMEEKWNNLKVLEVEYFLKRLELLKEQTELVLSSIKKSGAN